MRPPPTARLLNIIVLGVAVATFTILIQFRDQFERGQTDLSSVEAHLAALNAADLREQKTLAENCTLRQVRAISTVKHLHDLIQIDTDKETAEFALADLESHLKHADIAREDMVIAARDLELQQDDRDSLATFLKDSKIPTTCKIATKDTATGG
jgi:hypothetical protein